MNLRSSKPFSAEELATLAVFPLPRVVFFPGTALPLHLFEPRFRRLVEDCLKTGSMSMAVAMLAPGWEDDYEGRPEVHPVAGAGRIIAHRERDDGTHDIILQGLQRVRLHELPAEGLPYRRAQAIPIEDIGEARPSDVMAMMACANQIAARLRQRQPDFRLSLSTELPPGRAADIIADQLVANPEERQRILETSDVHTRVTLVTETIAPLLSQLSEAEPTS